MGEIGPNVFRLERKVCVSPNGRRQVNHGPYFVDEERAEVECGNCGVLINPMSVIVAYAKAENQIAYRFHELQVAIEKAQFKAERQNRVRCEHCSKLTRIRK